MVCQLSEHSAGVVVKCLPLSKCQWLKVVVSIREFAHGHCLRWPSALWDSARCGSRSDWVNFTPGRIQSGLRKLCRLQLVVRLPRAPHAHLLSTSRVTLEPGCCAAGVRALSVAAHNGETVLACQGDERSNFRCVVASCAASCLLEVTRGAGLGKLPRAASSF